MATFIQSLWNLPSKVWALIRKESKVTPKSHKAVVWELEKNLRNIITIYPDRFEMQSYFIQNPPVYGGLYFHDMAEEVIYYSDEIKEYAEYYEGDESEEKVDGYLSKKEEEMLIRASLGL